MLKLIVVLLIVLIISLFPQADFLFLTCIHHFDFYEYLIPNGECYIEYLFSTLTHLYKIKLQVLFADKSQI